MSESTLEPSVSFGRFQNDSLSWEKWSSFSPNKYLEEVEKCSTPGSVAQKKAYFEEHYKKIAAQKAEQLEQEKLMVSAPPRLDELKNKNCVTDHTGNETEFFGCNSVGSTGDVVQEADIVVCNGGRLTEQIELETEVVHNVWGSAGVEQEDGVISVVKSTGFVDGKVDSVSAAECQSYSIEDIKEEVSGSHSGNTTESKDREKVLSLEEEHAPQRSSQGAKDSIEVDSGTQMVRESDSKNLKVRARNIANVGARNIAQKKTPSKKDQSLAGTKKKVVSPAANSSPMSAPCLSRAMPTSASPSSRVIPTYAPRLSRATPTSASVHTSESSSKKSNGTHLPREKNTPVGVRRSATPTALHMSLSLGPENSSASLATTRRSLIMEQMADKDIIKRAFKAFQNNFAQLRSSGDNKFNGVSSEVPERNPLTPSKENEGLRKAADKRTTRGKLESKFSSASPRLVSSVAKKNVKAVRPSAGLKSDERADKRRENLEQKSIARGVEKAQLSAKSKEKDGEKEILKQNSKSTATPARLYSKASAPKSLQKDGVKNKASLPNR